MEQETLIVSNMKKLGFSEYECKAYLKLLEDYPLNGYALSKNSGIPRSRIYEVLNSLMDKQMVFEQAEAKNKLYYPVEPAIFISKLKSSYDEVFQTITHFTDTIYREKKSDDKLVVIKGRENIISFINLLIRGARQRIAMSVWEEELGDLVPELNNALERGVVLRGIYFGKESPYDSLVSHRRLERYIAEKKERYISIVIDSTHTLSGIVSKKQESKVTWSRDEGFIEISEDYIAHDLIVNLYSKSLGKKAYLKFEEFTDNVLKNYFHYSDEELSTYRKLR
jgi:sugar-specific transcriptional regulator TrmB